MKIYDLEKQATPGPFGRIRCPCGCGRWMIDKHLGSDGKWSEEDVLMWTHCRNHFMEVLESLKEIKDEFYQLTNGEGTVHVELSADEAQKIRDLITKMENVE